VASVLFPFHALCATFRQRTARVARRGRSRRRQHDVTRSASRENVTPLPAAGHVLPMRRLPAATPAPSRRDQPRAPPPPPRAPPAPPNVIPSPVTRASLLVEVYNYILSKYTQTDTRQTSENFTPQLLYSFKLFTLRISRRF